MTLKTYESFSSHFIEVRNKTGLTLVLSTRGAGIRDCIVEGLHMVATPENDAEYLDDHSEFYGKTIGPVAGRLDGGSFPPLPSFLFPVNPKNGVTLHSESLDYAFLEFDFEVKEEEGRCEVIFTKKVEASVSYPADVSVCVTYVIYEEKNSFDLIYQATPSKEAPLNLTNHVYWTIGGEDMEQAILKVASEEVASYDERLLPLKAVAANGSLDLREGKKVVDAAAPLDGTALNGVDHLFLTKKNETSFVLKGKAMRLEAKTDADGFQIYTFNYPPKEKRYTNGLAPKKHLAVTSEPVLDSTNLESAFLHSPSRPFHSVTTFTFFKNNQ